LAHAISNLVVLMMENRSFDHMFGFMMSPDYPIDGLRGDESNPDSAGVPIMVTSDARVSGDLTPDPGHHYRDANMQIFGVNDVSTGLPPATMQGFVRSFEQHTNDREKSHRIMRCFKPEAIPVITTLAREYAICDRWFSSVPGPTLPNRSFIHSATSIGRVDMSPNWLDEGKTIYELLAENNVDSKIYYHDMTMAMTFKSLFNSQGQRFALYDDFLAACANDTLPAYCLVEPRYNAEDRGDQVFEPTDQHPDHNVNEGERLIRDVYNAIFHNQKVREKTLLVIVYDEHGGLYDHVTPPHAASPDGKISSPGDPGEAGFKFDRLGIRVPAVLISPYIAKGTIRTTQHDHTSVIATARKLFVPNWQTKFLTERDRQAATFDDVLNLAQPRTDIVRLNAPKVVMEMPGIGDLTQTSSLNKPLTTHQQSLVQHTFKLEQGLPAARQSGTNPEAIKTEGQASAYMRHVATEIRRASQGIGA
jgi:phospholipase C